MTKVHAFKYHDAPDMGEHLINRNIALFLTMKHEGDVANEWYTRALEVKSDSAKCYYGRSVNYGNSGNGIESLKDAQMALKFDPLSTLINLNEASAYLNCNKLEEALMSLHNNERKTTSQKMKVFQDEIDTIEGIYESCLGYEFGQFTCANFNLLNKVNQEYLAAKLIDEKPRWKKLLDKGKCDVVSIHEDEEEHIHPREIERRKLAYKTFHQIYAGRSWFDLVFLNKLKSNKILFLPQTGSSKLMREQLNQNYKAARSFCNMLHVQNPLYHHKIHTCPDPRVAAERKQTHLYRVQYQTRREMFIILKVVKTLRETKRFKDLTKYVEQVMSLYPPIKTARIMPWKYQFIYEIYNTVALAICDDFLDQPKINRRSNLYDKLLDVLKVVKPKEKLSSRYVFGDKSTYNEPDAIDYAFINYKDHINLLINWMNYIVYPIEEIFVLYQISYSHLMQGKYKDCFLFITKCRKIAERKKNYLWRFLSNLLMVRMFALQDRYFSNVKQIQKTIVAAKIFKKTKFQLILNRVNRLNNLLLKRSEIRRKSSIY